MLIIRPYGRSETGYDDELRRGIRPRPKYAQGGDDGERRREGNAMLEVGEFAETRPELVVAQWISVIDKIARKPGRGRKPTPEQRSLRDGLGRAAFGLLCKEGPFRGRKDDLDRLWRSKIHPYPDGEEGSGREKGRWYEPFAGSEDPVDPEAVARRIREHLYVREARGGRRGRIAARADSIAKSVPPLPEAFPDAAPWSEKDRENYERAGDVAARIHRAARESKRRFSVRDAAPFLFEHYGKVFRDGEALPIAEARRRSPGLFALHAAIRDAYGRILKDRKKRELSMPADMDALFKLIDAISRNRDLNGIVRLGKILHYEATPPLDADEPGNIVDNWPSDVSRSRYRTSSGQSEIKRNEAFVRVWRHTIALAAQTLKAWADPNGSGDVLGRRIPQFDADAYEAKLPLLFGNRADLFRGGDGPTVLRLAHKGWADLRHSSFHFKGRGGFARALRLDFDEGPAVSAAREHLKRDLSDRRKRLIEALRAAHAEDFYDQEKLEALVAAVVGGEPAVSPLPRIRRVLSRSGDAWNRKPWLLQLPPPAKRRELEEAPALLCRYVVVKMLYERAFPGWLETQGDRALNGWIDCAVQRATKAARNINKDESAVARAAGLIELEPGQGIAVFFDRLSAETVTELRVQRGYDADADKARRQAKYIEDLKCDVVAQAFEACLRELGLAWSLEAPGEQRVSEDKRGDLDRLLPEPSAEEPEDWEAILYFLVHLVPVDAIGRLRHQLLKWSVLEGRPSAEAAAVDRVFGLYLDMHDARFEGAEGVVGADALRELFESGAVFDRVCPAQPDRESHVPFRGLREILRFGTLEPLMPVFRERPVSAAEAEKLAALEKKTGGASTVARQQSRRDDLHDKWVQNKRKLSKQDKSSYREALAGVVRHRRLAAHVRLNDHARLYRLLMEVIGRLVDYAGLWERDLYFATLGLIHLRGTKAEDAFEDKGLERLRKGRIVDAVRELGNSSSGDSRAVFGQLERLFGGNFLDGKGGAASVRNDLMHFNMLRDETRRLDMTGIVNDVRRLMSYDRKLKNAVSRSIIELMARENLIISWEMEKHSLACARIGSREIKHLDDAGIVEALHGERFVV